MKGIRTSGLFILSSRISIKNIFVGIILSLLLQVEASMAATAEVNGRIIITDINDSEVSVVFQINTTSGLHALGGATMILGFDTSAINLSANPIRDVDYIFHNFCIGNYSSATVTHPIKNRFWINIDLPFQNCHKGTSVAENGEWTDVVTINFDIIDQNGLINIFWLYDSPFWGIYDDDNSTFWITGHFEDALNIPLPVELSSFTAKQLADKVELNWTTESEVNNFGFDVERKVNNGSWILLDFVAGSGNSNTPKLYSFSDNKPFGGTHFFYRLKQIDTDGQFQYSEIIEVELIPHHFSLFQNYPNPFNPSTKIRYSIPASLNPSKGGTLVTLKVYDVLGNEVAALVNEEKLAGSYEVVFSAKGLTSGIYFYKLQAGSFIETKKMLLLK